MTTKNPTGEIDYSDEIVSISHYASGISTAFHLLIQNSAKATPAPLNLIVCLEIQVEELIKTCKLIQEKGPKNAKPDKAKGKNLRITSYRNATLKLNDAVSGVSGIFHLLIKHSIEGTPAPFDLIGLLKIEAEELIKVCKYFQENSEKNVDDIEERSA